MAKRNLKELNLLDDFLFGTLVSHKEFGEAFCRELLQTIFLYTKETQGDIPRELQELLRYMEDTTAQNAVNPSLRKIQRMVENVKEDKGVLLEYMKIWEWEQQIREEAIEEGREAGRKAGMKAGMEVGRKAGMEAGRKAGMEAGRKAGMTAGIEAGKQAATKTLTLNMLSKKKFSYEEIADLVGITTEEVRKIENEHNLPTA